MNNSIVFREFSYDAGKFFDFENVASRRKSTGVRTISLTSLYFSKRFDLYYEVYAENAKLPAVAKKLCCYHDYYYYSFWSRKSPRRKGLARRLLYP